MLPSYFFRQKDQKPQKAVVPALGHSSSLSLALTCWVAAVDDENVINFSGVWSQILHKLKSWPEEVWRLSKLLQFILSGDGCEEILLLIVVEIFKSGSTTAVDLHEWNSSFARDMQHTPSKHWNKVFNHLLGIMCICYRNACQNLFNKC